jgi:hypothetical protein
MTHTRRLLTVATATLACLATAQGAMAATPSTTPSAAPRTLAAVQASGAKATSDRISAINAAIPRVTANSTLTAADKSTILATLNKDLAGMTSLAAKIAADTTVEQASTDYRTIFLTYRVFAVALPQAAYASAADDLTDTTLPNLLIAQKSLAALLSGPEAAKNTPALQAQLADMSSKIATAQGAITGVAARALAVTPSEYDANHQILTQVRQSVATALAAAKAAAADGASITAALQ